MAQFFIINGITDPGLHHQIAQYAFLEGVESCDLYEYLHGAFHKEMEPLFFCVDQDGFRNRPEQLINILCICAANWWRFRDAGKKRKTCEGKKNTDVH